MGSQWVLLGSSDVAGLTFARQLGVVGFIRGFEFTRVRPVCRYVHPVYLGSFGSALGSSGVVGFTGMRPRDRWVHPGSLGSLA